MAACLHKGDSPAERAGVAGSANVRLLELQDTVSAAWAFATSEESDSAAAAAAAVAPQAVSQQMVQTPASPRDCTAILGLVDALATARHLKELPELKRQLHNHTKHEHTGVSARQPLAILLRVQRAASEKYQKPHVTARADAGGPTGHRGGRASAHVAGRGAAGPASAAALRGGPAARASQLTPNLPTKNLPAKIR